MGDGDLVGDGEWGIGDGEEQAPHTPHPKPYTPFKGICLTDTFQLYEHDDLISDRLKDNSDRRIPPGQKSANDNNQNVAYPDLDQSIRDTYAAHSTATNKNALYDSYIRAIRWASDRIGESGIIGYVSGSAWIERSFADGMRKTLAEEFTNIYVLNLRGDIRKNMLSKGAAKEGGNVFDSGSMTGIAISFFVKNAQSKSYGNIYVHDIGDDLTADEKRRLITEFESVKGITKAEGWVNITPDKYYDWINQRDQSFDSHIKIGDKKSKSSHTVFENYSCGVQTNRDAWVYNSSKKSLRENASRMIAFYNKELKKLPKINIESLETDTTKIKWSSSLVSRFARGEILTFEESKMKESQYRPFINRWFYFDSALNHRPYQMPKIFPYSNLKNLIICTSGAGSRSGFSLLISNSLVDLEIIEKSQCFPLYLYEKTSETDKELFASETQNGYTRRDAITDAGLAHFQTSYPAKGEGSSLSKEDLFYYIYGLLHSPEYRARYKDNLSKELPRIPAVKKFADFIAYSKAGRDLAHWHLNYETVETCKTVTLDYGKNDLKAMNDADYYVTKMKFAKMKDPETGKSVNDKSTIIYNAHITLNNIPLDAYDYVVNGKPAIEWVMDRQRVSTDKKSNITNDANLYATETMHNPKYPLELLLRVITVSQQTNKIVKSLPKLEID